MAHDIEFFCQFDGEPARAVSELASSLAALGVTGRNPRSGDGWCSCELARPGVATLAEFHGDDQITRAAIDFAAERPAAPDLSETNSLLVLTLSGPADDWEVVRATADFAARQWHGLACDEVAGFAVDFGRRGLPPR